MQYKRNDQRCEVPEFRDEIRRIGIVTNEISYLLRNMDAIWGTSGFHSSRRVDYVWIKNHLLVFSSYRKYWYKLLKHLPVSPNSWNRDFSPLSTPAVTCPLCIPIRIYKNEQQ